MRESATQRLTATAARLFQDRGLSRVGINEIIREADVARMSLYNNFHSKVELALASYAQISQARQAAMDAEIQAADHAEAAILAIFDLAEELSRKPSFRGCAFINLAAHTGVEDSRLLELVRQHKRDIRRRFEALASELGASAPQTLSRQLLALWDGALVDAYIEGNSAPIESARLAALALIKHAT